MKKYQKPSFTVVNNTVKGGKDANVSCCTYGQ